MARNIKAFQISGTVGKADLNTYGDKNVLNFSVAVNESKKVNEEWVQETDWFNCTLWNPTEYDKSNIDKGVKVFVTGKPKSNTKDNVTYWNWIVESVDYVGSKNSAQPNSKSNDELDDDVPF